MAEDLEQALGGIYSILSQEFQLPFVMRKMAMMEKNKNYQPYLKLEYDLVLLPG